MLFRSSYLLSKTQKLTESNDPDASEYFLSLQSMIDPLVSNKKYLLLGLAMVNNKLHLIQTPTMVTFLSKKENVYTVKLSNGSVEEFPTKKIAKEVVSAVFLFNKSESYEKFKTIMSLKFDFNLPGNSQQSVARSEEHTSELQSH